MVCIDKCGKLYSIQYLNYQVSANILIVFTDYLNRSIINNHILIAQYYVNLLFNMMMRCFLFNKSFIYLKLYLI